MLEPIRKVCLEYDHNTDLDKCQDILAELIVDWAIKNNVFNSVATQLQSDNTA